jgi:hypothetical protein
MTNESNDTHQQAVEKERARCVALVLAAREECDKKHAHLLTRLANDIQAGKPATSIKNPDDLGQ